MADPITLTQLGAAHGGAFGRAEALVAGVTDRQLSGHLRRGDLVALQPGVYRLAGVEETLAVRATAAAIAAGPAAAIDRWTAAMLLGLVHEDTSQPICIAVPRSHRLSLDGVSVVRRSHVGSPDVIRRHGVLVTSATRTIIDCAGVFDERRLEDLLDDALRTRQTALPVLLGRVAELSPNGRQGSAKLQRLLLDRTDETRARNRFENDIRAILMSGGLPRPVAQHCVQLLGEKDRYLDLAYPQAMVGIEAVSWTWHAQRSDWAKDRTRNNALIAAGWRMLEITWEQRRRQPAQIVELVRQTLALASSTGG